MSDQQRYMKDPVKTAKFDTFRTSKCSNQAGAIIQSYKIALIKRCNFNSPLGAMLLSRTEANCGTF